jgi:glucokinase
MAETEWAIGVDLGATKTEVGLVDNRNGKVCHREIIKTRAKDGPAAVIDDIANAVGVLKAKEGARPFALGVGMAGQIEKSTGSVLFAPNLGWREVPLQGELSRILSLPVSVINDVRAAARGEWLYGAGRGCDDLLCLFVGTGIGGGIVSGGRLLEGASNTAGEVGHIILDMNGPFCSCGNRGCFEALAGGGAIARRTREALETDRAARLTLLNLAGGSVENITAKIVLQAAREGFPLAQKIVMGITEALIAGVAGLVNAFNPKRVILGGGMIEGIPGIVTLLDREVHQRALKAAAEPLDIVETVLHGDAGVIGAASFAAARSRGRAY